MGLVIDDLSAYAFGLWSADGYWWSSSIGLTNTEPELIQRFARFLQTRFERSRLKLRVYVADPDFLDVNVLELADNVSMVRPHKMRLNAYQLYVNSRPLLRQFREARSDRGVQLAPEHLGPYFSGRLDGDGTLGTTPRICYSTREDAKSDQFLLVRAGVVETSIYQYRAAAEYCIYVKRASQARFLELLSPWSMKAGMIQ